jgi:hypothetical protein
VRISSILWRWRFALGVGLVLLAFGGFAVVHVPKAEAAISAAGCPNEYPFGRHLCDGYFRGQRKAADPTSADAVFYDGLRNGGARTWVSNINEYVTRMNLYLYDNDGSINPNYGSDAASVSMHNSDHRRNNIGAAHHIDMMLGKQGPDFGNSTDAGIQYARDNYARWEALVRSYDSRGLVEYGVMAVALDQNGGRITHSTSDLPNDDNIFFRSPFYTTQVIRFNLPGGGVAFQIEMDCGNIFGLVSALTQPPEGNINPPTPGGPGVPPGFNTGDSAVNSSCSVISGYAKDNSDATYAVPVTITFSGGATGSVSTTASTSGGRTYSVNTPTGVRNAVAAVQVTAVGKAKDGTNFTLQNSPITIGPCLQANPTCSGINTTPAAIDPGTPYSVTGRVTYGSSTETDAVLAQPGTKFFINVSGPSGTTNNPNATPISRSGQTLSATVNLGVPGQSGSYTVTYGITGPFGAKSCTANFSVTNQPYFQVNGGDISAGGGMSIGGNECSAGVNANQNAGIVSWNRGAASGYGGAGTAYGALALNHLQGFATAQAGGSAVAPNGLSFANTGGDADQNDAGRQLYGGEYGSAACTADFFANANNVQSGNITIGGQAIPNGTRKTIYVNGNVYITGNITFSGSYASASDIPAFSIIVKGNIYIAPGVTQLDGFYIAEPSSASATNGIIYTCAPSAFTAASLNRNLQNSCNAALTVNGSFVARQVWLLRTAGTLTGSAAETFNYVPELWLSEPLGNGLSPGRADDYDAITSLPPVL